MDLTKFFTKVEKKKKPKINNTMTKINKLYQSDILSTNEYSEIKNNFENINIITIKRIIKKLKEINSENKLIEELIDELKLKYNYLLESYENLIINFKEQNNDFTFTKEQIKSVKKTLKFLRGKKLTYGFYGYAGTGKTTTITKIVYFLVKNKLVKNIAFTASTNKATNILKSKFISCVMKLLNIKSSEETFDNLLLELKKKLNINLVFITLHKLFNYETTYDINGQKQFIQKKNYKVTDYDLVVVDECSMISLDLLTTIFENINKEIIKSKFIFVGDPAQLPPVNERVSAIFCDKINEELFINMVVRKEINDEYEKINKDEIKDRIAIIEKLINDQKTQTLTKVMRTSDTKIIDLCFSIREWINFNKVPKINKYKSEKIKLYKKDSNKWIKECVKRFQINTCIILTWTNYKSQYYNRIIREKIHNKKILERFEINDILIFTDYYKIKDLRFYTSEQVKVIKVINVNKTIKHLETSFETNKKLQKISNLNEIKNKYKNFIDTLNKTEYNYKTFCLIVKKLNEPEDYKIYVVSDDEQLETNKKQILKDIDKFRKEIIKSSQTIINNYSIIENYIIKPLIKEFNKKHIEIFANVDYGISMTVHKSQSSSYYNVFVDNDDILNNNNINDCKRCIYTAYTRAMNELHINL